MKCMIWNPCQTSDNSKLNNSENLQTNPPKIRKNRMCWGQIHFGAKCFLKLWKRGLAQDECTTLDLDCTSLCRRAITNVLRFFSHFGGGWTSFNTKKKHSLAKHRPQIVELMARGQGSWRPLATCHEHSLGALLMFAASTCSCLKNIRHETKTPVKYLAKSGGNSKYLTRQKLS